MNGKLGNILKTRRNKIVKSLKNNSILILYSGEEVKKSEDINYPFWVNRNYFYLANLTIQKSFFIILKNEDKTKEYISINKPDKRTKKFFGKGPSKLKIKKFGSVKLENIITNDTLSKFLKDLIKENSVKTIYVDYKNRQKVNEILEENKIKLNTIDIYNDIILQRSVKDKYEIQSIKRAVKVTKKGFLKIFSNLKKSTKEYELVNCFNEEVLNNGTHELAFDSIVSYNI